MRKKISFLLIFLLVFPVMAMAAGTVTQSIQDVFTTDGNSPVFRTLTFTCVGDSVDGSIPDTAVSSANMAYITGWRLYKVVADPGATAPDAADVLIKDTGGNDLLDGNGTNLIDPTATKATYPAIDGVAATQPITGTITLDVDNQATASATYTITLYFVR